MDLRDYISSSKILSGTTTPRETAIIHLSHDPFVVGENFDTFLQSYHHAFIILNIKSERIEYRVCELMKKYGISNYFFLDSSFPMIYRMSLVGEKKFAVRLSEYEDIQTVLNMSNLVEWVWVDCFTKNPLTREIYDRLKKAHFFICFVSPELQNDHDRILEYRDYFHRENIVLDMVCTKEQYSSIWREKV